MEDLQPELPSSWVACLFPWLNEESRRSVSSGRPLLQLFGEAVSSTHRSSRAFPAAEIEVMACLSEMLEGWASFEDSEVSPDLLHEHLAKIHSSTKCCVAFRIGENFFVALRQLAEVRFASFHLSAFHVSTEDEAPLFFPSDWARTSVDRLCSKETASTLCSLLRHKDNGDAILCEWLFPCLSERGDDLAVTVVEKKKPAHSRWADLKRGGKDDGRGHFDAVKTLLHVCIQSLLRSSAESDSDIAQCSVRANCLYKAVMLRFFCLFLRPKLQYESSATLLEPLTRILSSALPGPFIRLLIPKITFRARKLEEFAAVRGRETVRGWVEEVVSVCANETDDAMTSLENWEAEKEEGGAAADFEEADLDFVRGREHPELKNLDMRQLVPPPAESAGVANSQLCRRAVWSLDSSEGGRPHFEEALGIEAAVRQFLWRLHRHPPLVQHVCDFLGEASGIHPLLDLMERYNRLSVGLYTPLRDPLCRSRQALTITLLAALLDLLACKRTDLQLARCGLGTVVLAPEAPLRQAVFSDSADLNAFQELEEWVRQRDENAAGPSLLSGPSAESVASLIARQGTSHFADELRRVNGEIREATRELREEKRKEFRRKREQCRVLRQEAARCTAQADSDKQLRIELESQRSAFSRIREAGGVTELEHREYRAQEARLRKEIEGLVWKQQEHEQEARERYLRIEKELAVEPFEDLLPEREEEQWSVCLELIAPSKTCLLDARDALFLVYRFFGLSSHGETVKTRWTASAPLGAWSQSPSVARRVALMSSELPDLNEQPDRYPPMCDEDLREEDVLRPCSMQTCYLGNCGREVVLRSPRVSLEFLPRLKLTDEELEEGPLGVMQWAVDGVGNMDSFKQGEYGAYSENAALCRQEEFRTSIPADALCSLLRFRSDGRWNQWIYRLMAGLETDSLPLETAAAETVLLQCVWEAGASDHSLWNQQADEDPFSMLRTVIDRLYQAAVERENKMREPQALGLLAVLLLRLAETARLLYPRLRREGGPHPADGQYGYREVLERAAEGVRHIRQVLHGWVVRKDGEIGMATVTPSLVLQLQRKMREVFVAYSLTFMEPSLQRRTHDFPGLIRDASEAYQWLEVQARLADLTLPPDWSGTDRLGRILRELHRVAVSLQPYVVQLLQRDQSCPLDLVRRVWPEENVEGVRSGRWSYQRRWLCTLIQLDGIENEQNATCSIRLNAVTGEFLVDGAPPFRGLLPDSIRERPEFQRVFGEAQFLVSRDARYAGALATRVQPNGTRFVFCEAQGCEGRPPTLVVVERSTVGGATEKQLVHCAVLRNTLPPDLTDSHSHWIDRSSRLMEFRPRRFDDPLFSLGGSLRGNPRGTASHSYYACMESGFVWRSSRGSGRGDFLVSKNSQTFKALFLKVFRRLGGKENLLVWVGVKEKGKEEEEVEKSENLEEDRLEHREAHTKGATLLSRLRSFFFRQSSPSSADPDAAAQRQPQQRSDHSSEICNAVAEMPSLGRAFIIRKCPDSRRALSDTQESLCEGGVDSFWELESREDPGWFVATRQIPGVLVGLTHKLLLVRGMPSRKVTASGGGEVLPASDFRFSTKLLIPYGDIKLKRDKLGGTVTIDSGKTKARMKGRQGREEGPPSSFVFSLNSDLRRVETPPGTLAHLFLTALFAACSSPRREPFTGRLAEREVLAALQSSCLLSLTPFTLEELRLLRFIKNQGETLSRHSPSLLFAVAVKSLVERKMPVSGLFPKTREGALWSDEVEKGHAALASFKIPNWLPEKVQRDFKRGSLKVSLSTTLGFPEGFSEPEDFWKPPPPPSCLSEVPPAFEPETSVLKFVSELAFSAQRGDLPIWAEGLLRKGALLNRYFSDADMDGPSPNDPPFLGSSSSSWSSLSVGPETFKASWLSTYKWAIDPAREEEKEKIPWDIAALAVPSPYRSRNAGAFHWQRQPRLRVKDAALLSLVFACRFELRERGIAPPPYDRFEAPASNYEYVPQVIEERVERYFIDKKIFQQQHDALWDARAREAEAIDDLEDARRASQAWGKKMELGEGLGMRDILHCIDELSVSSAERQQLLRFLKTEQEARCRTVVGTARYRLLEGSLDAQAIKEVEGWLRIVEPAPQCDLSQRGIAKLLSSTARFVFSRLPFPPSTSARPGFQGHVYRLHAALLRLQTLCRLPPESSFMRLTAERLSEILRTRVVQKEQDLLRMREKSEQVERELSEQYETNRRAALSRFESLCRATWTSLQNSVDRVSKAPPQVDESEVVDLPLLQQHADCLREVNGLLEKWHANRQLRQFFGRVERVLREKRSANRRSESRGGLALPPALNIFSEPPRAPGVSVTPDFTPIPVQAGALAAMGRVAARRDRPTPSEGALRLPSVDERTAEEVRDCVEQSLAQPASPSFHCSTPPSPIPVTLSEETELGREYASGLKASWEAFHAHGDGQPRAEVPSLHELIEQLRAATATVQGIGKKLSRVTEPQTTGGRMMQRAGLWEDGGDLAGSLQKLATVGAREKGAREMYLDGPSIRAREVATALVPILCREVSNLLRLRRCVALCRAGGPKRAELEREVANVGEVGWRLTEGNRFFHWLAFEIDNDKTIRHRQVEVATTLLSAAQGETADSQSVTQLNMAEGKTKVIIPLLCLALRSKGAVPRVTLLRNLLRQSEDDLSSKLSGLFSCTVVTLPFGRDVDLNRDPDLPSRISTVFEGLRSQGLVLLVAPEHRQSIRNGSRLYNVSDPLRPLRNFMETHCSDIIDEADEVLKPRKSLVWTQGEKQLIDGGSTVWGVIQGVLHLVRRRVPELRSALRDDDGFHVELLPGGEERPAHEWQPLLLLSPWSATSLNEVLIEDLLNRLPNVAKLTPEQRATAKEYILARFLSEEKSRKAEEMLDSWGKERKTEVLLLRGLLSGSLLQHCLAKQWRVAYGARGPAGPEAWRKMAVPYIGKDTPNEGQDFAHPHAQVLFTQLHYYREGLCDKSFREVLRLLKEDDLTKLPKRATEIWDLVARDAGDLLPESMCRYEGLDLSDPRLMYEESFSRLAKSMRLVDLWLSVSVFPKECRQYPFKWSSTAFDLCKPTRIGRRAVGIAGTDGTFSLLPSYAKQLRLSSLDGTNGSMLDRLTRSENNGPHRCLEAGIDDKRLVQLLVKELYPVPVGGGGQEETERRPCRVLLDAGALVQEKCHRKFAELWLRESDGEDVDAAVFFGPGPAHQSLVVDRDGYMARLDLSPFASRLDRCVVYMDEVNCRGQDLQLPTGTRACMTLEIGMTKDKVVQSAMRLRQLGNGQAVTFWASNAAGLELRKKAGSGASGGEIVVESGHVLSLACEAAVTKLRREAPLFVQAADLHLRQSALFALQEKDAQSICDLYSGPREEISLAEKYLKMEVALPAGAPQACLQLRDAIRAWCEVYGRDIKAVNYTGADEEQERELEAERETEREIEAEGPRVHTVLKPKVPHVHPDVQQLLLHGTLPRFPSDAFISPPALFWYSPSAGQLARELNETPGGFGGFSKKLLVSRQMLDVADDQQSLGASENSLCELNDRLHRPDCHVAVVFNQEQSQMSSASSSSPGTGTGPDGEGCVLAVCMLSSFEASWARGRLSCLRTQVSSQASGSLGVSIRPFAPRLRPGRSVLFWNDSLALGAPLPRSLRQGGERSTCLMDLITQIGVLMGGLYLERVEEQESLCHFLGIFADHPNKRVLQEFVLAVTAARGRGAQSSNATGDCHLAQLIQRQRRIEGLVE